MPLCQFVIHTPQRFTGVVSLFSHPYNLVISWQVFIIPPSEHSFTGLVCLILVLCQLAAQPPVPANRIHHRPHTRAYDSQYHNRNCCVQHQCGLYHTIHQQTETAHNEEIAPIPFKRQFLKIRHYSYSFQFSLSNKLHNVSVGIDVSSIISWICSSVDRYSSFRQRVRRIIAHAHPPTAISANTTLNTVLAPLYIRREHSGELLCEILIITALSDYLHNRLNATHILLITIERIIEPQEHTRMTQVIENHLIRFLQLHCSYLLVSVQPLYRITGQKSIVKLHKIAAKNL